MSLGELIQMYGDGLLAMDHREYSEIAYRICGEGPAVKSAVLRARSDPESRLKNVINGRVLRWLHQDATGDGAESDTSGLQLF